MRVLVVPDKFKGTLSAAQAAEAIASGWRLARPADELELLPMSDGGDGFGEILGHQLRAEEQVVETVDAAHRPLHARWWLDRRQGLAIIESARVIGLALLPPGHFHPFELDTYGLGRVLKAAAKARPARCLVGVGGSATNDGGFGLARALGWEFRDAQGKPLEHWTELGALHQLERPRRSLELPRLEVAVDVRNRLLGPGGASRVYGPQKDLRQGDMAPAERCLRRLVFVIRRQLTRGRNPATVAGAGAAGGLGFGLHVFAGARVVSGFGLFAGLTHLAQRVRSSDLVITGEGMIDGTTVLMGKGVGQVARLCRQYRVPCLGLAGSLRQPALAARHFTRLRAVVPRLTDFNHACAEPERWLRELARRAAKL